MCTILRNFTVRMLSQTQFTTELKWAILNLKVKFLIQILNDKMVVF